MARTLIKPIEAVQKKVAHIFYDPSIGHVRREYIDKDVYNISNIDKWLSGAVGDEELKELIVE